MLGLIYDVHGNLEALEAVLTDAGEAGIGRFLLGGDYALFGLRPAETVERLRSLDARWIRGNVDRWTAHPHDAPDDAVLHEAIAKLWTSSAIPESVEVTAFDDHFKVLLEPGRDKSVLARILRIQAA